MAEAAPSCWLASRGGTWMCCAGAASAGAARIISRERLRVHARGGV